MSGIEGTPEEIEARLGAAIRQWRIAAGYSQEELAERASLSRSAVQNIETGQGSRLATLIRILVALGRIDALDEFSPRVGRSPMEALAAARRAEQNNSRAPRVRRATPR